MTKKQLIEKLKDVPDDMDIFLQQTNTEFGLSILEFAEVKVTTFAEGIEYIVSDMLRGYRDYSHKPTNIKESILNSPIAAFRSLWESINGPESWNANPFVWVVSFERIDKSE